MATYGILTAEQPSSQAEDATLEVGAGSSATYQRRLLDCTIWEPTSMQRVEPSLEVGGVYQINICAFVGYWVG